MIRHAQKASDCVIYCEILILKMLPKNRNRPGSIAIQDVAPLYHEMVDYSMEASVVVGESIYAPEANLPKVANRFRSIITKKSHNYPPQRRDTMSNIEINLRCHFKVSTVLEKEIMRMLKLCKSTRNLQRLMQKTYDCKEGEARNYGKQNIQRAFHFTNCRAEHFHSFIFRSLPSRKPTPCNKSPQET